MSDNFGMAAELAALEMEFGSMMTYAGRTVSCMRGSRIDRADLGGGGFAEGADLTVVVRVELLANLTQPKANSTVTIDGRQMSILSLTTSSCGTFYVLELEAITNGL